MTPRIHCAVKAIIVEDGKFLVMEQHTPVGVFWDLPGGRMQHGETPLEALHREVKEETMLEVEIGKPVGPWWFFRENDGDQVVCMTWLCTPIHTNVDLSKNADEKEILQNERWVSKEDFLKNKEYDNTEKSLRELLKTINLS